MAPSKSKSNKTAQGEFNENWESEIAEYDNECGKLEKEFREHYIILSETGTDVLTEEENEVFTLILNGVSCVEIARQTDVDYDVVIGLVEVIRAKLSLDE